MSESSWRLWEGREDGRGFFCFTNGKIQSVGSGKAKVGTWSRFLPVLPFSPQHHQGQQPAECSCPCTASWKRPSLPGSILLSPGKSCSRLCPWAAHRNSSGQCRWHQDPLLGVAMSSTARCFSPVERRSLRGSKGCTRAPRSPAKQGKVQLQLRARSLP